MCGIPTRVALVGCLVASLLLAMAAAIRAEQLPIKTYTTADGLARDQINRIVRDSRGFLWFCTSEGLSRFDGYKFTNYTTDQGLPNRNVNDLLETRSGVYWIATSGGLTWFNPTGGRNSSEQMFVAYHPGEGRVEHGVNVLIEDHTGTVWVGMSGGLYRLEQVGNGWALRFVDLGLPAENADDASILAMLEDRQGALWVGTGGGLYRHWPDGRTERYTTQQGLPNNFVQALLEDQTGQLWVGTVAGLCRINVGFRIADFESRNGKQKTRDSQSLISNRQSATHNSVVARVYTTRDGLSSNWINSLFQSSQGRLWIGTNAGLSEFTLSSNVDAPTFRNYTTANGLSDVSIGSFAEDRDGNLWIGSGYGAMKLARSGFTTYTEADGLAFNFIASIFEDRAGELCVIDGKQLVNRFDGKRFNSIRPNVSKSITYFGWGWNQITFQDRAGEWWVTTGQGLYRFPGTDRVEQLKHTRPKAVYTTKDGLVTDEPFRLYEDSRGDVWIATISPAQNGLARWERATGTFHSYSEADGWPSAKATLALAFAEDRSHNIWIGLNNGEGLARYAAGHFTLFKVPDGLPAGSIRALYLDHAGRLWIASSLGGLGRIENPGADRPRFITYTTAEGLSSNDAWSLTEDQWGRIYVGTGKGVDRLDPKTGHIEDYTTADGLARGKVQVAFRDRSGALWFGANQGLSRLVPEPDQPESPPPILISGLRIAGVAYPVSELGETEVRTVDLGSNQNQFQISFVGLEFGSGEVLQYQYKLEGVDRDWSAPTDQRTVNYASLSPGKYRFVVRAVTADAVISPTPATVAFIILPPIWQRWWFLTLAALFVCAVIYQIYRYRLAHLLALERVRTRIATDLHDDIGSNLSLIAGLSDMLRQQARRVDGQIAEQLSTIASVSRRSVDAMSDIVWAVNPQKDHLRDLLQRMRRFASDAFSARNIQLVFETPDADQSIKLGAETRREVFLIFKESVNNAVRHSGCAQANVSVAVTNGSLSFSVVDNGKGFDAVRVEAGEGLLSMRQRAGKIGGELIITSSAGTGTTVLLKAPLVEKLL